MDLTDAKWFKSSKSNQGGSGNCVEVAFFTGAVALRDSKDPCGPSLLISDQHWKSFISNIKAKYVM